MKGFIINHEINRVFSERSDAVEEMMFYGVLEDGKSFLWKQTQPYILAFLTHAIPDEFQDRTWKKIETTFTDYRKNPLWGYFFNNQNALHELEAGYPDYGYHESDISPGEQFLMSKHIRGSIEFLSQPERVEGDTVYYTDPSVQAIKEIFIPSVKVLSLDIETGMESDEIYAIGLYGQDLSRVLLLDKNSRLKENALEWGEIVGYPGEAELLAGFQQMVLEYNPHVFIGWNVMGFDFNVILRKFVEYKLSPLWGVGGTPVVSFKKTDKSKSPLIIKVPGRAIIEGMDLVKGIYDPLPNYKLNTAAEYILNEKKTIEKEGKDKVEEIERLYREDLEELARYNLYDARLVYDIFKNLKGIDFTFNSSALSGVVPEKIFNPHEVMDRYYLPLLHNYKVAAYRRLAAQVQISPQSPAKEFPGGFYRDVVVMDLQDLFLTVIMGCRIDPLGMVRAHIDKEGSSVIPNGVFFHDHDHILPGIISNLLDLKLEAENIAFSSLIVAIKNVLQQVSTCFGSAYSRYFLPGLYGVLETNVRLVMEGIIHRINGDAGQVIFYDNACLAIDLRESLEDFTHRLPELMNPDFFYDLFPGLPRKENYLPKVQRQLFFKEFFFPQQVAGMKYKSDFQYWALDAQGVFVRQGKKKPSLDLVAKIYDQVVYHLLKKEDLEKYLKDFKKALLNGDLDKDLVYRKNLSKKLSEYTGSGPFPPQVVAAMKAKDAFSDNGFFQKKVEYYQTVNGPEPLQAITSDLDYGYYLEKEFLPVLESILIHSEQKELIHFLNNQDLQLSLF